VGRRRLIVSRRRPTPGAGGEDPPPAPPVGSEPGRRTRSETHRSDRAQQGNERERAMNRVMALNLMHPRYHSHQTVTRWQSRKACEQGDPRRVRSLQVRPAGHPQHGQDVHPHPVAHRRRRRWRPLPPTLRQRERRRPARCRRRSSQPCARGCRPPAIGEAARAADRSSVGWRATRHPRVVGVPRDPRWCEAVSNGRMGSSIALRLAHRGRRPR
jgi:hypothetical protein